MFFFFSGMDIVTDFLLVNQYMTENIQIKYVENSNDSRIQNSTSEYLGNTTITTCQQELAYFDLVNEEGHWKFSCRERKYSQAILTLGFIFLPAVCASGAFLGPTIAGILGCLWSIIMIVCGFRKGFRLKKLKMMEFSNTFLFLFVWVLNYPEMH